MNFKIELILQCEEIDLEKFYEYINGLEDYSEGDIKVNPYLKYSKISREEAENIIKNT